MKELSALAAAVIAISLVIKYRKYQKLSAGSKRKLGFNFFDFYPQESILTASSSSRHRYMELANAITVSICVSIVLLLISIIGMLTHLGA